MVFISFLFSFILSVILFILLAFNTADDEDIPFDKLEKRIRLKDDDFDDLRAALEDEDLEDKDPIPSSLSHIILRNSKFSQDFSEMQAKLRYKSTKVMEYAK